MQPQRRKFSVGHFSAAYVSMMITLTHCLLSPPFDLLLLMSHAALVTLVSPLTQVGRGSLSFLSDLGGQGVLGHLQGPMNPLALGLLLVHMGLLGHCFHYFHGYLWTKWNKHGNISVMDVEEVTIELLTLKGIVVTQRSPPRYPGNQKCILTYRIEIANVTSLCTLPKNLKYSSFVILGRSLLTLLMNIHYCLA